MKTTVFVVRCDSSNGDFATLIRLLDLELRDRYGALQSSYDQHNVIPFIETVAIAYAHEMAAGCGCFKKYSEDAVEIKRMYVKPAFRRKGIAEVILCELENWAFQLGFSRAILETGVKQPEAIALYEKNGYLRIDNFGQYEGMPYSVCFEKGLLP